MSGNALDAGRDRFELHRLAEELATREASSRQERRSTSVDLPELLPLSHDNEYLTAPEFNVEEFLLSRSNISLLDLRAELREYLARLKEELVRLINDDYEAFISLSTDLQGEGERLELIKRPLGELRSQIQESKIQLQGVQDSVGAKLNRRAALREEKALLQLLLKISDSIARLESLLLISSPREGNPSTQSAYVERGFPSDVIADEKPAKGKRAKHLLRIATEYNQLLYHTDKASQNNCTFVAESQWRIERIKSSLSSDLEHHFAITLLSLTSTDRASSGKAREPDTERVKLMLDLVDCLRAYDTLGLWRDAEDVIRREVVRGFVKKTIYPGSLSGPLSPVMPHTPLAQQPSGASLFSRPPLTPYTPYSALPSRQDPFFANPADFGSGIYLLDDDDNPLAGLYNHILRFISRVMKPIMDAAERVASKSRYKSSILSIDIVDEVDGPVECGFDMLSNVIWAEVSRAIMDDLGSSVFAAGQPDEFRKNHETTQAFIRSIEYLAPSMQSVKLFRRHHSFEAFEQRWQLPIYFQLRWKDIVGRVEEALESKSLSPTTRSVKSANGETTFVLNQSRAIWNAVYQCWSPEIYLPDLGPRFWRLTLQLVKRYRTWVESSMPPLEASDKAKSPLTDKVSSSGFPSSRSSTPTLPQDNSSADRAIEDDKCLLQCASLMMDLKETERAVIRLWKDQISAMLPQNFEDEEESSQPENVLKSALSFVADIVPLLSSQVELVLARRCCDALAPVKSLPGQFRATSQKYMPTKPSSFVPLILRPVKLFFGIDTAEGLAKPLRTDFCIPISTNVVDSVSNRYLQHLSGMRKTEESLRRLRVGKRPGFSLFGGSGASNDDDARDEGRVRAQLILDVKALGEDAEALGVNLETCSSFKALHRSMNVNTGDPENS